MSLNEKNIRKAIKGKKNVRGYVKRIQKRIRDGVEVDEEVIVILVDAKVPKHTLAVADLIPDEIDGIPTDVIISEKVEAAGTKDKVSPLVAGYSIGHINISAGSLGYFFERIRDGHGPVLGSNRHVFSDTLGGVTLEKRILQPGPTDGGLVPAAATYLEGTNLKRALNPLNALWMVLVNLLYQLLGQAPPYDLTDSEPRNLDFAVAEPLEPVNMLVAGLTDWDNFCGIWFATSPSRSFFCKAKYITEFGYKPLDVNVKEAVAGDTVYKGDSRTTPSGSARVLYDSVFLWVSYGGLGNDRPFDDVVMTEKVIDPGDSGTAVFLQATFA
jgi:hypothetical protein